MEERKVVTSLFCDLVGFTAASESADPEDVDRMLALLRRWRGRRSRRTAGWWRSSSATRSSASSACPPAHEDDPERAVRAGLRIVEEADELEGVGGAPLRLRVGINTGEALVRLGVSAGLGRGVPDGDAVNTAARIQPSRPRWGSRSGSRPTRRPRPVFDYEELEPAGAEGEGRAGAGLPRHGREGAAWAPT